MATLVRGTSGQIVILNGAPRSGKSSVAEAIRELRPRAWVNLGVDASTAQLPERVRPGIGLRPGGGRPDLEELVVALYEGLWESIAAYARRGVDVVVDVGLHESFSKPRAIRHDAARRLAGTAILFVGVRCPLEVIWERRARTWGQSESEGSLREAVQRWQVEVHEGLVYDLEVDTSVLTPQECADIVLKRIATGPPGEAFARLAADT
jgi:chloramphenicol 3-O phosphotransferase